MSDIKENEFGELEVRISKEDRQRRLEERARWKAAALRVELDIIQIMVEKAISDIQKEEDKRIFEMLDNLEHTLCG